MTDTTSSAGEREARSAIDVVRQAIEERDSMERDLELLATEMVYKGNSVSWWHSKATAYRAAIERAFTALGESGVKADGKTELCDLIRSALAARASAAPAVQPVAQITEQQMQDAIAKSCWWNGSHQMIEAKWLAAQVNALLATPPSPPQA